MTEEEYEITMSCLEHDLKIKCGDITLNQYELIMNTVRYNLGRLRKTNNGGKK